MIGENIPIDYLSDHLDDSFQIVITFQAGKGYLGCVKFDNREVWRSHWHSEPENAFKECCEQIETNYQEFLHDIGK